MNRDKILKLFDLLMDEIDKESGKKHLHIECDPDSGIVSVGFLDYTFPCAPREVILDLKIVDGKTPYEDYLNSPEWKTIREKALERAGRRCQACNSRGPLDVHHRTYEHIGREELDDLTVLCRKCHGIFHGNTRLSRPTE